MRKAFLAEVFVVEVKGLHDAIWCQELPLAENVAVFKSSALKDP